MSADRTFETKGQQISCPIDCQGKYSVQAYSRPFGLAELEIGYHEICVHPDAGMVKVAGGGEFHPICTLRTPSETLSNPLLSEGK